MSIGVGGGPLVRELVRELRDDSTPPHLDQFALDDHARLFKELSDSRLLD